MATNFILKDAPKERRRTKLTARPHGQHIDPVSVVQQIHARFPGDMARLAE